MPNFTEEEKGLLYELVKQHKDEAILTTEEWAKRRKLLNKIQNIET